MPTKITQTELSRLWRSFLFNETVKNDKHHTINKERLSTIDNDAALKTLYELSSEQQEAIALFLYQHSHKPPLPYKVVAKHFDVDIAAVNGILSYGGYLFFNILDGLLKNDQ